MSYWQNKAASASNVRNYMRGEGWLTYGDAKSEKGEVTERGSSRLVDEALTSALNASNLLLLTGAGSSFCAQNIGTNDTQAPGMSDIWDAVVSATTEDTMKRIAALMPLSQPVVTEKNIEKFLTHCKIYLAVC
jgi:hypothetical protein